MAKKKKKRSQQQHPETSRLWFGFALHALWILLLLALSTYSAPDASSPSSSNCLGPLGDVAAFCAFGLFGVAAFGLPVALAVVAVMAFRPALKPLWTRTLVLLAMLAALAVLCDNLRLPAWNAFLADRLHLDQMPGGWVGYLLGKEALDKLVGPLGASLVALAVLVAGLFFISAMAPADLWRGWADWFAEWRRHRAEIAQSRRAEAEAVARQRAVTERERLKLEREATRLRAQQDKEALRLRLLREREDNRQRLLADRQAERERREAERAAREEARRRRLQEREEARQAREAEKARRAEEKRLAEEEARRRAEEERAAEEARQAELRRQAEEARQAEEKRRAEMQEKARQLREAAEAERAARLAAREAAAEAGAPAPSWTLPPMSLLQPIPPGSSCRQGDPEEEAAVIHTIESTLAQFGIEARVTGTEHGPAVTLYKLLPAPSVKIERIAQLSANITLALKAESIRILAPIPGQGLVGIEVPNPKPSPVVMRQLLESPAWTTSKAALPLALGLDIEGQILMADLAKIPHMLIAGATGMGKTVCMNSLLAGLLMTRTPDELRLMLIDPKIVEFSGYNGLPHLLVPVITEAKKVTVGLRWAIMEMERRFKLFQRARVRDIQGFNRRPKPESAPVPTAEPDADAETDADSPAPDAPPAPVSCAPNAGKAPDQEPLPDTLPYLVIVVDELADLMLAAAADIEPQIQRITQLARATGIHMVIATQRPTVDVITGTIKSNIPGRVAFKVAQRNDSRVILDQEGADKLIPKGDMLVLAGNNKLVRAQGAWTKDEEIQAIADFWKNQGRPSFDSALQDKMESRSSSSGGGDDDVSDEDEDIIERALDIIRDTRRASTSAVQRRLRIGYQRAARVMDILESRGYIGPARGSGPREILFDIPDDDGDSDSPGEEDDAF